MGTLEGSPCPPRRSPCGGAALRPREEFFSSSGFRFGAVAAGVKQAGAARRDVALIVSETPCAAAGSFTVNRMRAAPVDYGAGRLPAMGIRAIVANSGNANAITGPDGAVDERAVAAAVAAGLGVEADTVLTASTGAIGIRLPVDRIAAAVPALVAALGDEVDHGRRGDPDHGPHHQGRLPRDRASAAARSSSRPSPRGRG